MLGLWGAGTPWGTASREWGSISGRFDAVFEEYHVGLGGVGLMLRRDGYERRLNNQFAAQLSTAGTTDNDRLGEKRVLIDGWQGGDGTVRHSFTNPSRYRRGAGINIYEESGSLGLGPYMAAPANLQTAFNSITCLANYAGFLMIGRGDGKLYAWNGTTLSLVGDTGKSTGGIRSMASYFGQLFVGNGQDGKIWRWLGTTPGSGFAENQTVAGVGGEAINGVTAMSNHVKGNNFTIYYGSNSASIGLAGEIVNTSGTTDPAEASTLNAPEPKIAVLIQYKDDLIAINTNESARVWRMYAGNSDDDTEWRLLATQRESYINCAAVLATEEDGDVLFLGDAIQGRIWRWDGSDLSIYRQLGSDLDPYSTPITGMCSWRGGLWVSILDENGAPGIMRDNGSDDWSTPVWGLTGTTPGPLEVYGDQLHLVTQATGATKVFRTDGTFTSFGYAESALIDAKLGGAEKLWTGVTVTHTALAANQAILVQYQTEDASGWTNLGSPNTTVGTTKFTVAFPSYVQADLIAFKILIEGPAGGTTPLKVYALSARYVPADGSLKEWQLTVRLEGTTTRKLKRVDNTDEPLTGEELSEEIWALVETNEPQSYHDIDDQEYTVRISEFREALAPSMPQIDADDVGWDLTGELHLIEAV